MGMELRTLAEIRQGLLSGTQTVRGLMARTLAGGAWAPGAWISQFPAAELLRQAEACDARLAAEGAALFDAQPLFGMPFAVKDNIDVAGLPTTAACPGWATGPADTHAVAVQKLVAAGAIAVGKTNLDQFATGLVGTRSPYGQVPCAFDATRISGGSSSGSAYVVATGQVPFALGTDTAGSGRVPAGFNNLVGLKPTPGRVSNTGVLPACRSIDCVSIFALTVADAAELLAVIEGPDASDAYSDFRTGPAQFKPSLRVGIPQQPVFHGDAAYAAAFEQATAHVQALGHTAVPIDFNPLHATAELLYGGPWVAERHAVVEELMASETASAPARIDPTVRRVIEPATGMTATDAFRGQYRLREAQREHAALWQQVDVLMVPTAPTHPSFGDVEADPIGANAQLGLYTNFVNLLGWSALALPFGFVPGGLPFGVTFIAPGVADAALARFGQAWQDGLQLPLGALSHPHPNPQPQPQPGKTQRWPASQPTLPIAVVGAHLSGLPLNGQLLERGATLIEATFTGPNYKLYALPDTVPPKPGLMRVESGGVSIAIEVWSVPLAQVGSFLALVPAPLGLGSLTLADGRSVHGFICEPLALQGACDISSFGGWRAYLASLRAAA